MKKLLSIALVALAGSVFADEVTVGTGSTEIGVTIISTTKKNTIVPVAFASLTDGASAIGATNLVKVVGLPEGTILYAFNGEQYSAWSVSGGAWNPMTVVTGTIISGTTVVPGADNATLVQGSAIWVVLPEKPEGNQSICIFGAYTAGVTSPIVAGKCNLVANPLQAKADFTVAPVKGDQIIVPIEGSEPDTYTYNGSDWKIVKNNVKTKVEKFPSIEMGHGFWYKSADTADKVMSWAAAASAD